MQRSPGVYTAGTIYGQIGTNQIVGAGTSWTVADGSGSQVSNIAPLDLLWVDGQAPILIKSIEDDQHLTLGSKLPFGIPASTAYTIIKSTVTPSNAVQGLLQKVLALGTSSSPRTYEAFDNGVAAFRWGFSDDGRVCLQVGATGADGSPQHPWHDALLIDPATGNVTATGLAGGSGGSGNQFWYITGKPPNAIGIDGDVNFDFVSGFVVYRKTSGTWSAGLDIFGVLEAAVTQSAAAAAASATLAQGWAITADNTDVPGAPAGSRSAKHYADSAGASATAAAGSATSAGNSAQAAAGSAATAASAGATAGQNAANQVVNGKAANGANKDITSLGGLTTPLSVDQGGTGDTGGAWTSQAVGAAATSGSLGSATGTLRYKKIGRTVLIWLQLSISANGSGGGSIKIALPFTPVMGGMAGREDGVTGRNLVGTVSGAFLYVVFGDNSYPGASGAFLDMFGVMEANA